MSDFNEMFDRARENVQESARPAKGSMISDEIASAIKSFLDTAKAKGVIDGYTCSAQSQKGTSAIIQHIIHGVRSEARYKAVNRKMKGDFYLTLAYSTSTEEYSLEMKALGSDIVIQRAAARNDSEPVNRGPLIQFKYISDTEAQDYLQRVAYVLAVSEEHFKTTPLVAKRGGRVPGL